MYADNPFVYKRTLITIYIRFEMQESQKEPIDSALEWAQESTDSVIELVDDIRALLVEVKESLQKKEAPSYSGYDLSDAMSKADDLHCVLCHLSSCLKESPIPPYIRSEKQGGPTQS
jgi:hypothetical protein